MDIRLLDSFFDMNLLEDILLWLLNKAWLRTITIIEIMPDFPR